MEEKKYLKWYNKIGYGSGDIAGNVVYAFLTSFMMVYLTDSVGLAAGVVGTLIAVSKLFDGFTDIFFGSMIDKTHSKMGKAKPWMLYGYIGCAITLVCCFAIPVSFGTTAKYAWFFISYTLVIAAFIGSLIATGFILLVSRQIKHMATLLIAGTMIGYICSAITDFMITFAEDSDIVNLHGWSQGSFSGMSWSNVKISALIIAVAVILTFMLSKPIGAYQLGEAYAQSMGVNIRVFRVTLILLSSVLSATVTAFAGPISFVGIAVPHLVKQALNTSRPLVVIPGTFLGGAVFCMLSDLIARTAFAPLELNISTVTSIFGAPVVIAMMLKRQKGKQ